MNKNEANINNWKEIVCYAGESVLLGEVSGHTRQSEFSSKLQQTSQLLYIDREKGIAETKNTIYRLGKENVFANQM